MNTYRIETPDGERFTVDAEDSDMACQHAGQEAKHRNILSCRAHLTMVTAENEHNLGYFDMEGHRLPTSGRELQAMLSDVRQRALRDAKASTTFKCHRSRGVKVTADNGLGHSLIVSGDDFEFPKTLAGFRKVIAALQERFPDLMYVWAECGVDSAASVYDLNEVMDYEPWTGEASVLVWKKGHSTLA